MNRVSIESTRNGHIFCCVFSRFTLRFQFVDMMLNPQAIFGALSYAAVDALLIRLHILCHLTICTAVGIGDEALPSLLGTCALRTVHGSLQTQAEECEKNRHDF